MYYNPLDVFYKSHTGAVPFNKRLTIRVKGNFDSVVLLVQKDGETIDNRIDMLKDGDVFMCDIMLPIGLYFYCFDLGSGYFLGQNNNMQGEITSTPTRFQLSIFDSEFSVPSWLGGGIIYQIFPDRFNRVNKNSSVSSDKILHDNWDDMPIYEPNEKGQVVNNDFFGGDLQGIIEKLPYLEELGVSVIYLNPIFKAFSNHRYDTGDYMQIDELLGTAEDFKLLIKKANEHGIKIILDGVFNHTGDDSVYFNKYGKYDSIGAYNSKESKYYDWYNFKSYPNDYEAWWGIKVLPAVNESNADYVDFITGKNGVIEHYTKMGIGGWRLDVVDELPSSFVRNIRSAVKRNNKDAVLIGEVWEDASNKIAYGVRREYFLGKELDSVMNYPLKNAIINFVRNGDAKVLSFTVKEQIDHYPESVLNSLMNILSTHDTCRLITSLCGSDMSGKSKAEMSKTFISENDLAAAINKVKIASLLQFTLCGVPCIYYGDEAGMQGYIDPLNRRTYPWGKENKELISWYKFLGNIRKEYSCFAGGKFKEVYADNGAFIFERIDENAELLIAVNLSKEPLSLSFDGVLTDLISNKEFDGGVDLKENDYMILLKK
ncbi:MAG: glycoside hydrolase family 13 protein [Clostridiales bacterium]|nr:glycoside hydrolase family 13 protein [Clostridiales bacterium]